AAPRVYVTGGVQGAHRLNQVVGAALPGLLEAAQIIHQCGDNQTTGDRGWLEARRAGLPPALRARYRVVPYVGTELADVFAAAQLVISRAGAGTVNECCQLGLPAFYVPLPGARGDEQTANARLVEAAGGCVVLPEPALTAERLVATVRPLLAAPARLKEMGERARTLARPDAAELLPPEPRHPTAEASLHEVHEPAQAPSLDPVGPGRADEPGARDRGQGRQPAGHEEPARPERSERTLDVLPRRVLGEDRAHGDLERRSARPPVLRPEALSERRVGPEQAPSEPVARRPQPAAA